MNREDRDNEIKELLLVKLEPSGKLSMNGGGGQLIKTFQP